MDIETVAKEIVDSAIKVHRTLGPGLFESTYQKCLAYEIRKRGFRVDCEVVLPIIYDGMKIESGYRLGFLLNWKVNLMKEGIRRIVDPFFNPTGGHE